MQMCVHGRPRNRLVITQCIGTLRSVPILHTNFSINTKIKLEGKGKKKLHTRAYKFLNIPYDTGRAHVRSCNIYEHSYIIYFFHFAFFFFFNNLSHINLPRSIFAETINSIRFEIFKLTTHGTKKKIKPLRYAQVYTLP